MATVSPYEVEEVTIGFNSTIDLLLQQTDTRLRASVDVKTGLRGKTIAPVDYIAPTQFKQAGPRGSTLTPEFEQYQRRWVSPQDKDNTILVDSFDLLRGIADPKSKIIENVSAAANRCIDEVIIGAFFSTTQIGGETGTQTTETFDSGANFPVSVSIADTFGTGAETGMTIEKMNEAKRILMKYENPESATLHMGMTSQSLKDLMGSVVFTSTDFRNQATYDQLGRPSAFNGVMFHYSERWPYDPADTDARWLPMWVQNGMHLGIWEETNTIISLRNDLVSHPWQAYSMMTLGATRLQGGTVVKIVCLDATGGPALI